MVLRDPSLPSPLAPARDRPPSSSPARPSADPRERLTFELRGMVNQLLGRHLRGEDVQKTLVGGPLHGRRYAGGADALERGVEGTIHRYERIHVPVLRRRRGAMVLFVYAGTGPQLAMRLS